MVKLPKLKKKIHSFLTKEDGKISKENLVKVGILVTAFSVGTAINAKPVDSANPPSCNPNCPGVADPICTDNHSSSLGTGHDNNLNLQYATTTARGTHNHCVQSCHCNHSSHSSHGSHGSCGWHGSGW